MRVRGTVYEVVNGIPSRPIVEEREVGDPLDPRDRVEEFAHGAHIRRGGGLNVYLEFGPISLPWRVV